MSEAERTRFVTGASRYVEDIAGRDSAWLAVVRSDVPHGTISGIDTTLAVTSPGVLAVLTAADLDTIPSIPIRVGPTPILEARLQPVLASARVRYAGEPIAVVVAKTPAVAEHAAGLVFADIDPLPAVG